MSLMRDACSAAHNANSDLPLWGSLIRAVVACDLDLAGAGNQTPNATDAFGLFWATGALAPFKDFIARFNQLTGLNVGYKERTIAEYIQSWLEMWPTPGNPGPNDYWMIGAEVFGEDIAHGAFADLTLTLDNDPSYFMAQIPAALRDAGSSAFAGRYSSLPFWLTAYTLLYRRDVFQLHGLSVPRTWEDVLAIADQYGHGRLGPGMPPRAFCFESNPACGFAHASLMHILGTMVQLEGARHGTWFDPEDLQPLYTGEAMREALRLFKALKNHSIGDDTPCFKVYGMIATGECLMMWGWSFGFKAASHNSSAMRGRQGVASTPGSTRVLDRRSGRLVPCSPQLCPLAQPLTTTTTANSTISATTTNGTGGGSSGNGAGPSVSSPAAVLVNSVLPLDNVAFAINAHAPLRRQAAAFAMLHTFTGPEEHLRTLLIPSTELSPMRSTELDEDAWVAAGYEVTDVREFLRFYESSFEATNIYYELRIPGVFQFYTLIQNTLIRWLSGNYTAEELLEHVAVGTEQIVAARGGRAYLLPLYRLSVGYTPPPAPALEPGSSGPRLALIGSLVPALGSLVVLGAALWALLHFQRLRRERRARRGGAPGTGPATTLLVTDIQDSTCLWESLAAEVMDAAVKTHHRVIRGLLVPHHGYESATEGDSFILAFHKPDRALAFALAAQDALLAADWPEPLLDSPYAPTLWVQRDAGAAASLAAALTPSTALRSALAAAAASAVATAAAEPVSSSSPARADKAFSAAAFGAAAAERATARQLRPPSAASSVAQLQLPLQLQLQQGQGQATAPAVRDLPECLSKPQQHQQQLAMPPASPFVFQGLPGEASSGCGAGQPEQLRTPVRDPRRLSLEAMLRRGSCKTMPWPSAAELRQPCSEAGGAAGAGGAAAATAGKVRRASASLFFVDRGSQALASPLAASVGAPTGASGEPRGGEAGGAANATAARTTAAAAAAADGAAELGDPGAPSDASWLPAAASGSAAPLTLQEALARAFPELSAQSCSGRAPPGMLLFRGLRVRIGMHCGLSSEAEVQYNRASGRVVYPGRGLQLAKAVSDCGRGGQITLTQAVQRSLDTKAASGGGAYVLLCCGWHVVKEGEPAVRVRSAFSRGLVARAAHMEAPRSVAQKVPGSLQAPLGRVVVALAQVQDVEDFAGWGLEVSMGSHATISRTAGRLACLHGGYLVATAPGSVQAVFTQPAAGVQWLLELQDELGPAAAAAEAQAEEEAALQSLSPSKSQPKSHSSSRSADTWEAANMLRRATAFARLSILHIKGGVVAGPAVAAMGDAGDVVYSGWAVKRAACLAAHAQWHEVLASAEVVLEVAGEVTAAAIWGAWHQQRANSERPERPSRRISLRPAPTQPAPDQAPLSLERVTPPISGPAEVCSGSGRRWTGDPRVAPAPVSGPDLPGPPAGGRGGHSARHLLGWAAATSGSSRARAVTFSGIARSTADEGAAAMQESPVRAGRAPAPASASGAGTGARTGQLQPRAQPLEAVPTGITICGRALCVVPAVRVVKFRGGAVEACPVRLGPPVQGTALPDPESHSLLHGPVSALAAC